MSNLKIAIRNIPRQICLPDKVRSCLQIGSEYPTDACGLQTYFKCIYCSDIYVFTAYQIDSTVIMFPNDSLAIPEDACIYRKHEHFASDIINIVLFLTGYTNRLSERIYHVSGNGTEAPLDAVDVRRRRSRYKT